MRVQCMNAVHHLPRMRVSGIPEFHGIPLLVIRAPVLPILHNDIQRNLQSAVLFHYTEQLPLTLIALPALPIAKDPTWKHRSLTGKFAPSCKPLIGVIASNKIIIHAVSHHRHKRRRAYSVLKHCGGAIIPKESVAIGGIEVRNGDIPVALLEQDCLVTLIHLTRLVLPQLINSLLRSKLKRLSNLEGMFGGIAT